MIRERGVRALGFALGGIVIAAASAAGSLAAQAAPAFTAPSYAMTIGQPGAAFVYPWGMAYDPTSGTILTSDYNNYQVRRFTTAGSPDGVYSSRSALNGQQPYGIAVDPTTGDFVVDDLQGYDRYTSSGTLVDSVSAAAYGAHYAPWIALNPVSEDGVRRPINRSRRRRRQRGADVQSERPVPGHVRHHRQQLRRRAVRPHPGRRCGQRRQPLRQRRQQPLRPGLQPERRFRTLLQHQVGVAQLRTAEQQHPRPDHRSHQRGWSTSPTPPSRTSRSSAPRQLQGVHRHPGRPWHLRRGRPAGRASRPPPSDPPGPSTSATTRASPSTRTTRSSPASKPGGVPPADPGPADPAARRRSERGGWRGGLQPNGSAGLRQRHLQPADPGVRRAQQHHTGRLRPDVGQPPAGTRRLLRHGLPARGLGRPQERQSLGQRHPLRVHQGLHAHGQRQRAARLRHPEQRRRSAPTPSSAARCRPAVASPAARASFFYAKGIFVGGPKDDVYVTDSANGRLQVLTQAGTEVAGFPVACGTPTATRPERTSAAPG